MGHRACINQILPSNTKLFPSEAFSQASLNAPSLIGMDGRH